MKLQTITTTVAAIATISGLGLSTAQAQGWTAYNDMFATQNNQNAPHVTSHSYNFEPGQLKDVNDGSTLGVTVKGSIEGPNGCYKPTASTGGQAIDGTDAGATFNDIVNLKGSWELEHQDCVAKIEFSGLNPDHTYTIALTANRDNKRYEGQRYTRVEITGADNYFPASTWSALPDGDEAVSLSTGYNTDLGEVAQWEQISPSADGTFTIESQWDRSMGRGQDNTQGYAMSAFRLTDESVAPQPVPEINCPCLAQRLNVGAVTFASAFEATSCTLNEGGFSQVAVYGPQDNNGDSNILRAYEGDDNIPNECVVENNLDPNVDVSQLAMQLDRTQLNAYQQVLQQIAADNGIECVEAD